jgi:hypothetical protein
MSRHIWQSKRLQVKTVQAVLDLLPDHRPWVGWWVGDVVARQPLYRAKYPRIDTLSSPTPIEEEQAKQPNPSLDRMEHYGTAFLCAALEWDRQSGYHHDDSLYNVLCRNRQFKPGTFGRPEYIGRMWPLFWPHLEKALSTPTAITADKLSGLVAADRIEELGGNMVHARFLRVLASEPEGPPLVKLPYPRSSYAPKT